MATEANGANAVQKHRALLAQADGARSNFRPTILCHQDRAFQLVAFRFQYVLPPWSRTALLATLRPVGIVSAKRGRARRRVTVLDIGTCNS